MHFLLCSFDRVWLRELDRNADGGILLLFFDRQIRACYMTECASNRLQVFFQIFRHIRRRFAIRRIGIRILAAFSKYFIIRMAVRRADRINLAGFIIFARYIQGSERNMKSAVFDMDGQRFDGKDREHCDAFLIAAIRQIDAQSRQHTDAAAI